MASKLSGVLLVDKPGGMTSHDVVHRLRKMTGQRKIGHIGTLDPMAEGLLVCCLGDATRIVQFLMGLDKTYVGTIELGGISSTYDAEGEIIPQNRAIPDDEETIARAMAQQVGDQIQLPPPYSAVKVKGKKLYQYARSGEAVPEKPRTVRIHRFDLLLYEPPQIHFEAVVGTGTYIRSMAQDLGLALGCGGYLGRLRRTKIGAFPLEAAMPLDLVDADPDLLPARMLSVTEALAHLPKVTISPEAAGPLLNGQPFTTEDVLECEGILNFGRPVLVLDHAGRALSIVRPVPHTNDDDEDPALGSTPMLFRPVRVLAKP